MTNKPTSHELALIVQAESKTLIPTLLQASREVDVNKRHGVLLEAFSKIDVKQDEFEIYQKALSEQVVERKVVGKKNGIDIVQYPIVKSRNILYLTQKLGRPEVAEIIKLLIVNVNNSFNIKNGLNLYQVDEIAENIIDIYGEKLFIDQLIYIFKKAKTSAELYQTLDMSVIFRWIDIYLKNMDYNKMKKESEYKSEGFDLPKLPKGMLKQAAEKLQEKFVGNMIDIGKVEKPLIEKKKKKKQ